MTATETEPDPGADTGKHPRAPAETRAARMDPLAVLPVFFKLDGRRAVLAGGTEAAAWKAELLSAAGATVDVFAADPSGEMVEVAGHPPQGAIHIHR
ncbi:MAG: NAD(P)-dependent oxidoreductase, partial [Hyphomicrobium sp.]